MGGMSGQVMWNEKWTADSEATLRTALASIGGAFQELPTQHWDPSTSTIGGIRDYQTSYVAAAADCWSSVLLHLNSMSTEPLARALSRASGLSIAFMEYDQSTWGYCLFKEGALLDRFWSSPEIVDEDASEWRGDATILSEVFGVPSQDLSPYLGHVDDSLPHDRKAYADDEFPLSDHWVRCDFMRRLGLHYPNPGEAEDGRHVHILDADQQARTFETSNTASAPQTTKPWWKFW